MTVERKSKEVKIVTLSSLIIGDFFEYNGALYILLDDSSVSSNICLRLNDDRLTNIGTGAYVIPVEHYDISITYRR